MNEAPLTLVARLKAAAPARPVRSGHPAVPTTVLAIQVMLVVLTVLAW